MELKNRSNKGFSLKNRGVSALKCMALGFCLFPINMAFAEMRHHDSHVHGEGTLNIAIAGKEVHIELESPAANIVGFEHSPKTHEQEEAVHLAEKQLNDSSALFLFNKSAQCKLTEAKVTHDMEEEAHHDDAHHEEHDHKDDHHHDHKDGHHHEEHKDTHHHDHADEDGHHHEHEGDVHSEFHAAYSFECAQPEKLQTITVELFETFKSFEEIDVQLLTPKGQTAATLTSESHTINL